MVDRTALCLEAVAMGEATADTILQAFLGTWIARFGVPRTVTSDRGAQFTSRAWKTSLVKLGRTDHNVDIGLRHFSQSDIALVLVPPKVARC